MNEFSQFWSFLSLLLVLFVPLLVLIKINYLYKLHNENDDF